MRIKPGFTHPHAATETCCSQPEFVDLCLPIGGKFPATNRRIKLAGLRPWAYIEERSAARMAQNGMEEVKKRGKLLVDATVARRRHHLSD